MISTRVVGLAEATKGVRGVAGKVAAGTSVGLRRAGLYLQRESMKIVPVDTGHLKAGAFMRHSGTGLKTVVRVGYQADYAIYVHEDLSKAHGAAFNKKYALEIAAGLEHSRGENQVAKYLEIPVRLGKDRMGAIIRQAIVKRLESGKKK